MLGAIIIDAESDAFTVYTGQRRELRVLKGIGITGERSSYLNPEVEYRQVVVAGIRRC
jgi:hypothetical protein